MKPFLLLLALSSTLFAQDIQRFVAIDNVCAWPNLTLMSDGSINTTIFGQPSHGQVAGAVECWNSKDGQFWEKRGIPAPNESQTNRMNVAAGLAKNGDLLVLCSGWTDVKQPQRPKQGAFRDDILSSWICRSSDGGKTWSEAVTLFEGHFWNCHTGMVQKADRLYWATDDLALGKLRGPRIIAGDLSGDPMNPKAWRMSAPVPFPGVPEAMTNPQFDKLTSQYLEPNVIDVRGKLRVLMTVKPKRQSTSGLCAVLDFEDKGGLLDLKFTQFHPMPGGQLKFCVIWDEVSKMFWATANLVVDGQGR